MRSLALKTHLKFAPMGVVPPGAVWGQPAYGPGGVRHEGSVTVVPAGVWPVGTGRPDAKGAAPVDAPQA
jgi:hypothetical protein